MHVEAKLAAADAVESYGKVMRSKGLHARAQWAFAKAKAIRTQIAAELAAPLTRAA